MAKQVINQTQFGTKYSATEQLTGDVWIDGKPIYRKTFTQAFGTSHASFTIATGITAPDNLINTWGLIRWTGQPWMTPFPTVYSTSQFYGGYLNRTSSDFIVTLEGNGGTAGTLYVTLEYTKV